MKFCLFPCLQKSVRLSAIVFAAMIVLCAWSPLSAREEKKATAVQEAHKTRETQEEQDYSNWVRTELFFGAGVREGHGDAEKVWQDFLDTVVTPRFPEGLTLLEGRGQWRVKEGQKPRRNRSRVMILIHEGSAEKLRQLEEVRELWKERSGHVSVLIVTTPAEVSF